VVAALLRRSRLLLALAVTACLTPNDPGAGDVGELRIRPQYASGAEPEALGVTVDSAAVVADPDPDPVAPAVDAVVELPDPDASLSWLVEVADDAETYRVRIELTGGARVLYRGEADIDVTRGGLGTGTVRDVPVTYVGPGAIAEITVTPGGATLVAAGATQPFTAEARDADGALVDATFAWTSDAAPVATVDGATGLATAVATGVATIAASAKGVTGAATLTVAEGGLAVTLTPAGATLSALGATRQFTAAATDAAGTPVAGATFAWTTSAAAVVTVDATGLVTATGEGSALVVVETGGVADTAAVSVVVVTAVDVTPATVTLATLGATQQFTAVARDGNGDPVAGVEIAWSSSAAGVATVDVATGLATAVGNGTATITATAGAASGAATLEVAQAIASVEVSPATATLTALGATQQFTAVARDANGTAVSAAFSWTSSDPSKTAVDPASGLATAVAAGQVTISATAGGQTGGATLTVAPGGLTVEVTPASATLLALGETRQLTAVARAGDGTAIPGASFAWLTRDPAAVAVDQAGLVTAAGAGSTWVVAETGGAADSAEVTVTVATTVEVTPGTATLTALGATRQYAAVARDAGGNAIPGAAFTWTSSATAVATVDEATGVATATGNGSTTITATAGAVSGSASLVVDQVVTAVEVSPATATLTALGATRQFTALARDANGHTVPGAIFTWSSMVPSVGTVDGATGVATATGNGATTITATAESVSGSASLVVDQVVTAVEMSPGAATLTALGATQAFSALGRDANGHDVPDAAFAWESGDPAVATVDPATGVATAAGAGTTPIRAIEADGAVGTAALTVAQAVVSVLVAPAEAELAALDQTIQFSATAVDANGNSIPDVAFAWSSIAAAVATVDPATGLATAIGNGETAIMATADGITGTAALTVRQVVVAVKVSPWPATLSALGATLQFAAEGRDANGHVVADAVFAWHSTNPAVATVDPASGLATAVANGSVTITAAADGAVGAAELTVTQLVASVEVMPAEATLTVLGATRQFTAEARDANGHVIAGTAFAWTSSDVGVATVDPLTGLATAIANGTATIRAAAASVAGEARLKVCALTGAPGASGASASSAVPGC
jgi:uncharacterized protein YjdB